jgi:hypothetical protein
MATKIKLGSTPKTFTTTVKFTMLDGSTGEMEVTYKYRTRKQWGEFVDSMVESAESKPSAAAVEALSAALPTDLGPAEEVSAVAEILAEEGKFSMADMMAKTCSANARYILGAVKAWDLDFELNADNLDQLADEVPAATAAIMASYAAACRDGRLGNS